MGEHKKLKFPEYIRCLGKKEEKKCRTCSKLYTKFGEASKSRATLTFFSQRSERKEGGREGDVGVVVSNNISGG